MKKIILLLLVVLAIQSCKKGSVNSNTNNGTNTPTGSAGTLDSSFGTNGMATISFGYNGDFSNAACLQTDGKILISGYTTPANLGTSGCMALLRLNADGTPDNSFGRNGRVINNIAGVVNNPYYFCEANAVAVLKDGKIIIAGMSGGTSFAIAKYNTDGTLDNSFGTNGNLIETIDKNTTAYAYPTRLATAQSIYVQPDGKFIVSGLSQVPISSGGYGSTPLKFAMVRYNPDGSRDNSFGVNGESLTVIDNGAFYDITEPTIYHGLDGYDKSSLIAGKNNSLVAVLSYTLSDIVLKFNSGGFADNSFGNYGMLAFTSDIPLLSTYSYNCGFHIPIAIQSNGNILLGGSKSNYSWNSFDNYFGVSLTQTGALDNSFANNGFYITTIDNGNQAIGAVAVQSTGKIVFSGGGNNPSDTSIRNIAVGRLSTTGAVDTTFGNAGIALSHVSNYSSSQVLLIDTKDRIYLVTNTMDNKFMVIRYKG